MQQKIAPSLWFDTEAEEAAEFYVSVFENARIIGKSHYNDAAPSKTGMALTVEFELDGQRFTALNGGPRFEFTEALSLLIRCEDQKEIDYYWETLTDGGEEGMCGWLKDRFGVSWQVWPPSVEELFADPDAAKAERAMKAMFGMRKIEIAVLRQAADGAPAP